MKLFIKLMFSALIILAIFFISGCAENNVQKHLPDNTETPLPFEESDDQQNDENMIDLPKNTYTVIYDYGNIIESFIVEEDSLIQKIMPTRKGYNFINWCIDTEFNNSWDFAEGVKQDITLYANWENNVYKIRLNFNEGNFENPVNEISINYNTNFTLPIPIKENHIFREWNYEGYTITDENGCSINPYLYDFNITVDAIFEEIKNPDNVIIDGIFCYTLNDDKSSYTISANKIALSYPTTLIIPTLYNELPITKIAEKGFENLAGITEIIVQENIIEIGKGAFSGFSDLIKITLPFIGMRKNIDNTEESVFGYIFGKENFDKSIQVHQIYNLIEEEQMLVQYYIPGKLNEIIITNISLIPTGAFNNLKNITKIVINDSISIIGAYAFADCEKLSEINLPKELNQINTMAFAKCNSLEKIVLDKTVNDIEIYAFFLCSNLKIICNFSNEECIYSEKWDDIDTYGNKVNIIYKQSQ